jgi:hypothetical protein
MNQGKLMMFLMKNGSGLGEPLGALAFDGLNVLTPLSEGFSFIKCLFDSIRKESIVTSLRRQGRFLLGAGSA